MSRGLAPVERFLSQAGFDRAPWLVVAFATGILAWFSLPSAGWWTGLCGVLVAVSAIMFAHFPRLSGAPHVARALVVLPLVIGAGCLAVWSRSELAGQPALERPVAGLFTGQVLKRDPQPALQRERVTIAMREPETGRAIKVRLNVPLDQATAIDVGDTLRFRGRLMPPAPPMLPGGYDFARASWFNGLAATGSTLGDIEVVQRSERQGRGLSGMRRDLSEHIRRRIGDETGGIATALVTGDRGGIAEADDQAMRDSGLAHLLSVSGLHVSAVVGAVYMLVLRVLALFPWLALRLRLPVVAAGAGAVASVLYTLLSGSEVPTVRSCLGALLVLGAMAIGREPLSLRTLATAAFVILLLWPESLMGPSFQMSFGAVLALIAVTTSGPARAFLAPKDEGPGMRVLRHLAMLLVTGIVIDLVLMPIGLHHFHRAGVYGALANVAAIPLTTFVVMPLLAGALLLDTLGAGWPLWRLAEIAIHLLVGIAHWFSSRPGAVSILPVAGQGAFALFVAGGLWLGLWSGRHRWLGLPPALAGALLLATAAPADILVSGDGRHVGLIEAGGKRLFVLRGEAGSYPLDTIMELAGMKGKPILLHQWPGARCNDAFCLLDMARDGATVRLLIARGRDVVPERALAAACERVDIVIADRWLPRSCRPRWFKADRALLERTGGLAVDFRRRHVETVAARQGEHGWWRPREFVRDRSETRGKAQF